MKKLFLLINIFTSLTIFGQDISKGLIAYYPFNENSKDESGNGNDGTVYGARLTSDRKGNINSAFSFNGYSDYIKIEDKPELSNISTISVSLWVKKESHSNDYEGIVTKWYQLASNTSRRHQDCYGIYYNKNAINGFTNNYGTVNKFIFATAMVSSWHHIVFEHSSSSGGKLYIDGRLQGVLGVYGQISNSTNPVIIGADNAGGKIWRFFNGVIDDVRIYNRTLSETEIAELYNDGGTTSNTNISQNSNSNNVNIYESLKKFDCYTSVTPEIYNIKTQDLFLLKLSDNILSLVSSKDWTEKKKIKNEEDEKMKLSSSYIEGNDLYIALYNQKKNEIPYYLKLNLSTLETEKIKCSKTERGCIISSASSDYIKPERNKPYKLNENVIFFRNDGTQFYYEVSKIVEEKEDYSKALNGNYKDKVNFLKKYQNSTYSKEVEKKLFDNLKSIKEVATFSKENTDYNEKSVNRAYEIAKSTKSKTELNDFINNFSSSKFASEIKAKLNTIENEEEQQRIANENARIQREKEEQNRLIAEQKAREQKIADDKKREAEYQKYLVDKEKNRISKIKSATEGDKICYVQNRVSVYDDRDYFFGFQIGGSRQEVNYSMKVICFVEKNLGEKVQVRVGTVSSSNKNEYAQVVIDGVEYSKGDLLWIKPLKDSNWFIED